MHCVDRHGGDYADGPEGRRDVGYADQYRHESYRVPEPRPAGESGPVLGPRSGVELPPLPYATEVPPYTPEPYVAPDVPTGALPQPDLTAPPLSPPLSPPGSPPLPPLPPPGRPQSPPAELGAPGGPRSGGYHGESRERTTPRRATGGPATHSSLYLARRAGLVGVLTALAVVAELLLIRVLVTGEFGHTVMPGSVLGAMCGMAGVPLVAVGLYGLMSGVPAVTPHPSTAWLRAPLAYLPVGLVLLLAAGIAVG